MKYCSNCGREIRRFERICPECGFKHSSSNTYFNSNDNYDKYMGIEYAEKEEHFHINKTPVSYNPPASNYRSKDRTNMSSISYGQKVRKIINC